MLRRRLFAVAGVIFVLALPCAGDPPAPAKTAPWAKRWSVEFANGVKEHCELRQDGTASVTEPLRTSAGKLESGNGSIVVRFEDDRVERWTPVGGRMVVEHWFPGSAYPCGKPVFGIGEDAR